MKARFLVRYLVPPIFVVLCAALAGAQQEQPVGPPQRGPQAQVRDGYFLIVTKGPEKRQLRFEEFEQLVRDRDMDPSALYRVRTGGYLAFDESEWVDKIEFKLLEKSVREMPQYPKYAELLKDINEQITSFNDVLKSYDSLALRLMNMCDKTEFPNLTAIDENILQQLTAYRKLVLLRALVVNSMSKLVADQACPEKITEYRKSLDIHARRLTELSRSQSLMTRRALTLSAESDAARQTAPAQK
jgi:hypothetical protein